MKGEPTSGWKLACISHNEENGLHIRQGKQRAWEAEDRRGCATLNDF